MMCLIVFMNSVNMIKMMVILFFVNNEDLFGIWIGWKYVW